MERTFLMELIIGIYIFGVTILYACIDCDEFYPKLHKTLIIARNILVFGFMPLFVAYGFLVTKGIIPSGEWFDKRLSRGELWLISFGLIAVPIILIILLVKQKRIEKKRELEELEKLEHFQSSRKKRKNRNKTDNSI